MAEMIDKLIINTSWLENHADAMVFPHRNTFRSYWLTDDGFSMLLISGLRFCDSFENLRRNFYARKVKT